MKKGLFKRIFLLHAVLLVLAVTIVEFSEEVRKDFIANLSHEIKTPITAIKGFAETLLEGALDDKEHALKFLRSVQQNSERINSLVDDLMVLSRIELGDLPVEKAVLNVRDVIENVSAILEMKAAEKALSLQTFIGEGSHLYVRKIT
jgi:two-component system, OmpR family, phosphate regulon sensor histidine kinase PhoR